MQEPRVRRPSSNILPLGHLELLTLFLRTNRKNQSRLLYLAGQVGGASKIKGKKYSRGSWVAQPVKHPTLGFAQVVISGSLD